EFTDRYIDTNKLYPADEISPYITTIFELLSEASDKLEEALISLQDDDQIGSDDAKNHLLLILPELFCCRSAGEGFKALINGIFHAIRNIKADDFLSYEQIVILRVAINKLNKEPFLPFDDAIELIMKIDEKGLTTEPKHFAILSDLINE
ncbi:MAG: hypothetical protein GXP56_00705, partial [Deltaproteobacteria bacterium]|nr:hypothetical protein [Deltaproteobacteria bacterium]